MDTRGSRAPACIPGLVIAVLLLAVSVVAAGTTPVPSAAQAKAPEAAPAAAAGQVMKEKVRVYTNADLEKFAPLPGQKAPIAGPWIPPGDAGGPEGWNNIVAFIERERANEQRRQDREMAREAQYRAEKQQEQQYLAQSYYGGYYPGYYSGYYTGGCVYGDCARGGRRPPQESNLYSPLSQRGIRSAADAFHESVRNSTIRRANIP